MCLQIISQIKGWDCVLGWIVAWAGLWLEGIVVWAGLIFFMCYLLLNNLG